MSSAVLTIQDVHKWYGQSHVLRGLSLEVSKGEVVCVLGPSGSGKSTLLRCINHLETLDRGRILLKGEPVGYADSARGYVERRESDIALARRRIGFVFQQFNLFPHMTNVENVSFGPIKVHHVPRAQAEKEALELLRSIGLEHCAELRPGQLSGGQQQRVAIARAMAMHPELFLFDEPTSALDPELVGEVLLVIRRLASEGRTMVLVTHEIEFAREAADTVVFIDEGVVVEMGPATSVIDNPKHPRTRQFLAKLGADRDLEVATKD